MDSFPAGRGYLAACTAGLPSHGTLAAQRADLDAWSRGESSPAHYGALVEEGRALFADLVDVPAARVIDPLSATARRTRSSCGSMSSITRCYRWHNEPALA